MQLLRAQIAKKKEGLTVFFALFGSEVDLLKLTPAFVKAGRKMLVKSTPGLSDKVYDKIVWP